MPQINSAGLSLIKSFEGCVLYAYDDANDRRVMPGDSVEGTLTIGYGHTGPDVHAGQTITQAQADALLQSDLKSTEEGVNNLCARSINPNQFAALVSFAYNCGVGCLEQSTLMRLVNLGEYAEAQQHFAPYCHDRNGNVLEGLVRRRAAEAALFGAPC